MAPLAGDILVPRVQYRTRWSDRGHPIPSCISGLNNDPETQVHAGSYEELEERQLARGLWCCGTGEISRTLDAFADLFLRRVLEQQERLLHRLSR